VRYLKRLSANETFQGNPWEFTHLDRVPPNCITDKVARTKWQNELGTDFCFYSAFTAVNESSRINESGGKEGPGSPREMDGWVGDYDARFTDQEIDAAIARMDIKPNWVERSLSGNIRLVWIFERPIMLSSRNYACFILKHLHELLPIKELSNLDQGYLEPSRYYANGCQWRQVEKNPVPWAVIAGWLVKKSRFYSWKDSEPGVTIPAADVAARFRELAPKYPRFAEWEGEFAWGAMGPTFWVEGSTSDNSAIVHENGMQSFANHAQRQGKGWYSWSELLGADWVKRYEENRIGNAVKDIFFDGKDYAVKRDSGRWDILNKDNIQNEMIVMRGLTRDISKKKGETFSEVEAAFAYIHTEQRVKGMASFAFFPKGKIFFNGHYYLNMHTRDAMAPAEGKAIWGPDGQFPWISQFYDNFFATLDQLPFYLSWASYFYKGCYYRTLTLGHAIYIAGPVACGKTFSNRKIIGEIVGGFAEAASHLLGETQFNSQLFDYALHTVDDTSVTGNSTLYKKFCEGVKKNVANNERECNEKFRVGGVIGCRARQGITCNMDADSQLHPDLDASMKDKVMMFRAQAPKNAFPPEKEMNEILARELPWFCRFLLDFETPEQCRSASQEDTRFGGIKPYHDPEMVLSAQQSSRTSGLAEVINIWMREYFTKIEPDANVWLGSALDLYQQFSQVPGMTDVLRQFSLEKIKRDLWTLSKGTQFKIRTIDGTSGGIRIYEIDRSSHYPKNLTVLEVPEQRTDSRYQKTNEPPEQLLPSQ